MKNLSVRLLVCTTVIFLSCKKDNKSNSSDCEINNYAVIKASFGATNIKHSILITAVGGNSVVRDKIIEAGKASDTIRLTPGSYNINIASLNNSNQTIQDANFSNRGTTQCQETNLQVTF
jgi:hypothetical protein